MSNKGKKIIRIVGIVLIVIGVGVIAYPFYTNLVMKRQEVEILNEWEQISSLQTEQPDVEESFQDREEFEAKSLVVDPEKKVPFKITIPDIETEWIVNAGTDIPALKKGPGHYTGTALPGETGRCVIAGHRTTYGAPFNRVDELQTGDEIIIETIGNEEFVYLVTEKEEVPPEDVGVLQQTENATLALTTCAPKFYATRRLIVYAELKQ
ncbi:MAG: class E sortase [Actinobacteria bacterium]|nr:class E sortase [Actinomycetota bacterium]